jgi:hypothetical protein
MNDLGGRKKSFRTCDRLAERSEKGLDRGKSAVKYCVFIGFFANWINDLESFRAFRLNTYLLAKISQSIESKTLTVPKTAKNHGRATCFLGATSRSEDKFNFHSLLAQLVGSSAKPCAHTCPYHYFLHKAEDREGRSQPLR